MTMLEHAPGKNAAGTELRLHGRAQQHGQLASDGGRGEDGHGYPPDSAKSRFWPDAEAGRAVPEIASVTGARITL